MLEQAQLLTWLSKDCDRLQLMLHIAGYRLSSAALHTCHWRRRKKATATERQSAAGYGLLLQNVDDADSSL